MIAVIGGPSPKEEKPALVIKAKPIARIGGPAEDSEDTEETPENGVDARKEAARLVAKALGMPTANIESLSKALGAFVDACGNSEPAETGEALTEE